MEEVGDRWRSALVNYLQQPALIAAVAARADAFFVRYPGLERSPVAVAFISGIALDEFMEAAAAFSAGADSQSAPASKAATEKQVA
jgi:hypothetical protein